MKIGLTYTGSPEKHRNYVGWLKSDEEKVEVIRLSIDDPGASIGDCDALVLSGGVDIHPELYGGGMVYPHSPEGGWQRERDLFEIAVFKFALDHKMPVLGVCRGLQLINISLRGTLIQDLGEEKDGTHENVKGTDKEHVVLVDEGTLLYDIAEEREGAANSAHHQAIDKLGEGLAVNCRAGDGTIEGIEWADTAGKPFMLAVQWHPERMFTNQFKDRRLYKSIRDRFITEIKK
jgi:putative glutamine amidotransferase